MFLPRALIVKYLMQGFDRFYLALLTNKKKSKVPQVPTSYDFSALTRPEFLQRPELFYPAPEKPIQLEILAEKRHSDLYKARAIFESPVGTRYPENRVVPCRIFRGSEVSKSASAVFLHGWARRSLSFESRFCSKLARLGVECLLLTLPFHLERTPAGSWSGEYALSGDVYRTVEGFRQAVIEARAAKEWLGRGGGKVGIVGISLGGMIALAAMAAEEFDFGVTIVAGGDNAGIVWEGVATKYVKRDIIRAGVSRNELRQIWMAIDPTRIAHRNLTQRLLMINGLYDEVIKSHFAIPLWEALGRPPIKWLQCAHISSIFFMRRFCLEIAQMAKGGES